MGCAVAKKEAPPAVEANSASAGSPDTGHTAGTNPPTVEATTAHRYNAASGPHSHIRQQGRRNPAIRIPEPPRLPSSGASGGSQAERDVLKVVSVDFLISKNTKNHHTDMYELASEREENGKKLPAQLIVRRGEPFDITVQFDREFDNSKDDLKLIFDVGSGARESRGTSVVLMLSDEDKPKEWGAALKSKLGASITITVYTPDNAAVAKWNFKFDTVIKNNKDEKKVFRYEHPQPVYLLFNPWCKDDSVFMFDEVSRREYVLNPSGRVYCGTANQISSRPWNFGQFEDFMLDVCFYLLDKSSLSWRLRGDPVHIVRRISAMTNSQDDNGVLVGNWSGYYEDGTPPSKWFGSVDILEKFWKTKQSVKYGQCWVFSAVVTTICRCIGIPARSVTNFASAHDCDGSITIDTYWSHDGKPLEEFNEDSVWNFHVWNDVWMTRPDLPHGFGGWQAIDATPQETSDGIYCAGPASVEALKNGLVHLAYDGPFIFAEVNADRVHWIQKPEGGWAHTVECFSIGKNISTTGLRSRERMDITDLYKFPDGSKQERTAVWRAAKACSTKKEIYQAEVEDMDFDLKEKEDAYIGEDFDVTMKIKNKGKTQREVHVTLTATVVNYTGVPHKVIKTSSASVKIKPNEEGSAKMVVKFQEYYDKLVDMCHIKISSMSHVEDTKQFHCQSDDFRLKKPDIIIKVPDTVKVNEEAAGQAFFKNPLPITLNNCQFQIQAPLLLRPIRIRHLPIPPNGEGRIETKMTPTTPGDKEIIVSFNCNELYSLFGTAQVKVV